LLSANRFTVFDERGVSKRATAVEDTYAEDIIWYEPDGVIQGRAALNARASELQTQSLGFKFRADGIMSVSQNIGMLRWCFGPEDKPDNPPRWGWVYNEEEARRIKDQKGYNKIKDACKRARDDGLSWIWVDTNCIDKTNSAELSEAINSMYQWYQKAQVCYAFLADVPPSSQEDYVREGSKFRRSRWFTRGWTLQELIAPNICCFLRFVDADMEKGRNHEDHSRDYKYSSGDSHTPTTTNLLWGARKHCGDHVLGFNSNDDSHGRHGLLSHEPV
jgi:hypothetical protein